MAEFFLRLFVKDYQTMDRDPVVRQKCGMVGGAIGIFLNVCLFGFKLLAGLVSNSIAIMADAVNNLSDAGSSVVTLFGFKMAGKPADEEHPFGHGRIEYVAGLIVSMAIMLMGIELPLIAIQQQIASALDVIIHLGRLRDKSRKVLEITEVLGYENGRIQLQTLYKFQEEGMEDGKIKGTLMKENEITQREKLLAAGYSETGIHGGSVQRNSDHGDDGLSVL